jgi:hypothetical protein
MGWSSSYDLIFWLLLHQAKCCKRIQQKSGEKNENEKVKENEYDCEVSLIVITAWQEGKVA